MSPTVAPKYLLVTPSIWLSCHQERLSSWGLTVRVSPEALGEDCVEVGGARFEERTQVGIRLGFSSWTVGQMQGVWKQARSRCSVEPEFKWSDCWQSTSTHSHHGRSGGTGKEKIWENKRKDFWFG